jgi:hypothetical protein
VETARQPELLARQAARGLADNFKGQAVVEEMLTLAGRIGSAVAVVALVHSLAQAAKAAMLFTPSPAWAVA